MPELLRFVAAVPLFVAPVPKRFVALVVLVFVATGADAPAFTGFVDVPAVAWLPLVAPKFGFVFPLDPGTTFVP